MFSIVELGAEHPTNTKGSFIRGGWGMSMKPLSITVEILSQWRKENEIKQ
jgi:hypothetical protein